MYFIQNKIIIVMCIVKDDLLIDSKRNMEGAVFSQRLKESDVYHIPMCFMFYIYEYIYVNLCLYLYL